MLGFIGRWLSDAVRLTFALTFAIAAAQLPALTGEYAAALLQVGDDLRRDLDQREQAGAAYYHIAPQGEDRLIAALAASEPSNAQALTQSRGRLQALRAAYQRIGAAPPLLQPPIALYDALTDAQGDKRAMLQTTLATHVTQIAFSTAAAIYGLIGLVFGAFLAQILVSLAWLFGRPRRQRLA